MSRRFTLFVILMSLTHLAALLDRANGDENNGAGYYGIIPPINTTVAPVVFSSDAIKPGGAFSKEIHSIREGYDLLGLYDLDVGIAPSLVSLLRNKSPNGAARDWLWPLAGKLSFVTTDEHELGPGVTLLKKLIANFREETGISVHLEPANLLRRPATGNDRNTVLLVDEQTQVLRSKQRATLIENLQRIDGAGASDLPKDDLALLRYWLSIQLDGELVEYKAEINLIVVHATPKAIRDFLALYVYAG